MLLVPPLPALSRLSLNPGARAVAPAGHCASAARERGASGGCGLLARRSAGVCGLRSAGASRAPPGSEAQRAGSHLALGSVAMENQVLTPHVYWAQRHRELYLRVELSDVQVKAGSGRRDARRAAAPGTHPNPLPLCPGEHRRACSATAGSGPALVGKHRQTPGLGHDPLRAAGPFGCCVSVARAAEAASGLLFVCGRMVSRARPRRPGGQGSGLLRPLDARDELVG